ncbi:hypothetical protein [Marinoscillum sp.]|uniref:hypothetical protein n=1 Tax=Marinoscillum sp. TaxID=2024838 RepID=UPI003BABCA0D
MRKLCIIAFLITSQCLFAQNDPISNNSPIPPAPNAASLGEYVDIPVNLYSGLTSIDIPIYSIRLKDFQLPISINYHSAGIKVAEESSPVGLGWALMAGGVINQNVNDWDDFGSFGYLNLPQPDAPSSGSYFSDSPVSGYGEYVYGTYPESPNACYGDLDYHSAFYYLSTLDDAIMVPDLPFDCTVEEVGYEYFVDKLYDTDPDIFSFRFGKYSGKFLWDSESDQFEIIDRQNILVNYLGSGNGFELITPDGIKYTFGQIEIHDSQSGVQGVSGSLIDGPSNRSFYLTEIETVHGELVTFSYSAGDRVCQLVNRSDNFKYGIGYNGSGIDYGDETITLSQGSYIPLWLDEISFPYGTIEFEYANRLDIPNGKRLSNIAIKNSLNQLIKTADFDNDQYFIGHTSTSYVTQALGGLYCSGSYTNDQLYKRLKLNGVSISGQDNPYTFDYNESISLPSKLSFAQDYWGYYNGNDFENSFLPEPSSHYEQTAEVPPLPKSQDRRPNNNASAWILKKITYPTGGYSIFDYDQNTFSNWSLPADNNTDEESSHVELFYSDVYNNTQNYKNEFTLSTAQDILVNLRFEADIDDNTDYLVNNIYFRIKNKSNGVVVWSKQFSDAGGGNGFSCSNPEIPFFVSLNAGTYEITITKDNLTKLCTPGAGNWLRGSVFYSQTINANDYSLGGGLRISRITRSDGVVKEYDYHKTTTIGGTLVTSSHGVAMNIPRYYRSYFVYGGGGFGNFSFTQIREISSNPHGGFASSAQGSFIGYSKVVEKYTNTSEELLGSKEYIFLNQSEIIQEGNIGPGVGFLGNGLPKSIIAYDQAGTAVQKEEYNYYQQKRDLIKLFGIKSIPVFYPNTLHPNSTTKYYQLNFYPIQGYRYDLKGKKSMYYDSEQDIWISSSEDYTYSSNGLLESVTRGNSDNSTLVQNFKYPFDYSGNSVLSGMKNKNMLDYVIEEVTTKNPGDIQISKKRNNYQSFNSGSFYALSGIDIANASSPYESRIEFSEYNQNGNVLKVVKDDGTPVSYLWSFNYPNPTAEVVNANPNEIAYTSFESYDFDAGWSFSGALISAEAITGDRYFQMTGTQSIYSTNQIPSGTYILEFFSDSPISSVSGGDVTNMYSSTADANGWVKYVKEVYLSLSGQLFLSGNCKIDDLRLYPVDAEMTSYTYKPLVGITSKNGPDGSSIVHYQYDSNNRLYQIEDREGNVLKEYKYNYTN